MDVTIGSLKIGVVPDFTGFAEKLRTGLGPAMQQAMANMQTSNQRINGSASGSASAAMHIATAQAGSIGSTARPAMFGGFSTLTPGIGSALTQAAAALNQAAQQMSLAAGNMNRAGGGGGSSGYSGGRMRGLSGLSRYVAAGFLAREGLSAIQAGRGYMMDSAMAGNDSAAQYGAEMNLYNRVAGIPIFGQAADLLSDPTGSKHLANQRTMDSADTQDRLSTMNYGLRIQTINMQADAALARFEGAYRKAEAAQREYEQSMQGIASQRGGPDAKTRLDLLAQQKAQETSDVQSRYSAMVANAGIGNEGNPQAQAEAQNSADEWRQRQLSIVEANDMKRRQFQDKQFEDMRKSAFDKLDAQLKGLKFEYRLDSMRSLGDIEGANYRMQGRPRAAIISGAQYEKDVLAMQENTGKGPYDLRTEDGRMAYTHALGAIDAHRDEALYRFDQDTTRQRYGLRAQEQNLALLTARDGGSPANRAMNAQANDLLRQTQLSTYDAFTAGRGDLVPDIYKLGALRAKGLQQEFMDSARPVEIDPMRTALSGPGVANPNSTLEQILSELNSKIPPNLPNLLKQMGAGMTAG